MRLVTTWPPAPRAAEQRIPERGHQIEVLDPLGCPRRADLRARHAPDLLGVGLEEDLEEAPAEPVAHPGVERAFVGDGKQLRAGVARQHARRFDDTQAPQRVDGPEGIVEELPAVVDAGHPAPHEQVVAEDLVPQPLDLRHLGEEPVAADVQPATAEDDTARDAPHQVVGLEDDRVAPEPGQLEGRRQPGRAGPDNDRATAAGA